MRDRLISYDGVRTGLFEILHFGNNGFLPFVVEDVLACEGCHSQIRVRDLSFFTQIVRAPAIAYDDETFYMLQGDDEQLADKFFASWNCPLCRTHNETAFDVFEAND
jgi:hypothetical protein